MTETDEMSKYEQSTNVRVRLCDYDLTDSYYFPHVKLLSTTALSDMGICRFL